MITKSNFNFLKQLGNNNSKTWFDANKPTYQEYLAETQNWAEELLNEVRKFDEIETPSGKKSLYRIYRDVRFSKDKTLYKTHWGGYFRRAGKDRRGGFFFHLQPGNTFIGGGFWSPNKDDLLLLRQHIEMEGDLLIEAVNEPSFKSYFGEMRGEALKTAPKGFDKEHEHIDLLRMKQFLVTKSFTDKDVHSEKFAKTMAEGFKKMLPFFDVMTDYLTTNLNGESILN